MKQAVDKESRQNLSGEGVSLPLSSAVAKTQVLGNRFQTEIKERKERRSVKDIWIV
jgi:hypothetical protein